MKKTLLAIATILSFNVTAQVMQVADINVGAGHSTPFGFLEFNGEMYFTATTTSPPSGNETWKYNGITSPVMIIDSITNLSYTPVDLKEYNGKLYFTYRDFTGGGYAPLGLWSLDVTNTVTRVIDSATLDVSSTFIFNNKLYLVANDGSTGLELWEYDGTNFPSLVADINPSGGSSPNNFAIFNNKLYFGANSNNSNNLMEFDGVNPPSLIFNSNTTSSLIEINNKLYFTAQTTALPQSGTLFEYDGVNTPIAVTPNLGTGQSYYAFGCRATFGGKLFFSVFSSITGQGETWVYDGINPASVANPDETILALTHVYYNNEVYYVGQDSIYGYELWKYDLVNTYTRLTNINTTGSSLEEAPFAFQNKLYFMATDGITGYELWSYDPNLNSVSKVENQVAATVFPNPTTDVINIQLEQSYNKVQVELYNALGQVVLTQQNNDLVQQIKLPKEAGVYFVKITADGKSFIQKVVKE